jgi:hypothetical protein
MGLFPGWNHLSHELIDGISLMSIDISLRWVWIGLFTSLPSFLLLITLLGLIFADFVLLFLCFIEVHMLTVHHLATCDRLGLHSAGIHRGLG